MINKNYQQFKFYTITAIILNIILLLCFCLTARAEEYTDEQIVNAIYKAEGGIKAEYPYGIRSIQCDTVQECKQICLNTVRNQRKRHSSHNCGLSFLECLAKRYCPVNADNDPKGLNKHWLKNVMYWLERL